VARQAKNTGKLKEGENEARPNREIIRDLYRENCVAEVAVHVAHMLRHRRDLLGRHSFTSPWVMQTADREERELEDRSKRGDDIHTGTKQGRLIKEQIERSDRIGRYIGVANQQVQPTSPTL
jgi:hypothetical protein